MNASQLARRANVPRQNISNWLMNQKPKDIEQVKRVADVFQVTVDHLLFGKPNPIVTALANRRFVIKFVEEIE